MTLTKKIIKALKAADCECLLMSPLGEHVPRLLVRTRGRRILLMEVMDAAEPVPARKVELAQRQFFSDWQPCCRVVESVDDALKAVTL